MDLQHNKGCLTTNTTPTLSRYAVKICTSIIRVLLTMCMYTKEADMWVSNLVHPFEVDISEHLIEFVFRNGGLYVLYCVNQSFWPGCAFNSGQHEIHVQYFTASNDFKFTQHFDSTLIVADLSSLTHKHPELQLVHITAA